MTNTSIAEQRKTAADWKERIKFIATLLGICSPIIAIATFFGLRPERHKELEMRYLQPASLMNTDPTTEGKLRVRFGDREIARLVKQSINIQNVGTIPIEP